MSYGVKHAPGDIVAEIDCTQLVPRLTDESVTGPMSGPPHDTLVDLLQKHPGLLDRLLHALGHPGLPPHVTVTDSTVRVTNPVEVRPDVVLVEPELRGPWTLVEVQRSEDIAKQRRWLSAASVLLDARGAMRAM